MITIRTLLFTMAAVLVGALPAWADDGAIYGVGGDWRLMKGHPQVRMVAEDVDIRLPEGRVDARFVFRNEGPATTVVMGFPETGHGTDISMPRVTGLRHFRSEVDGRSVRVARWAPHGARDEEYRIWWIKRVRFQAHQTRVVRVRYVGGLSYDSSGGEGFEYTLTTGASWNGPIGRATIVCHVDNPRRMSHLMLEPAGARRHGREIRWEFRNFKPRNDISVDWMPPWARGAQPRKK